MVQPAITDNQISGSTPYPAVPFLLRASVHLNAGYVTLHQDTLQLMRTWTHGLLKVLVFSISM